MSKSDAEILSLLHPTIQSVIKKKWQNEKGFMPIQKKAIPIILENKNCLIISPTSGGKTEAAFLPVLSNIYESAICNPGIHIIFIAPLKALLNDLEDRLQDWLRYIEDITLFKWHGDVGEYQKQKQRKNPASILLTTPESLDVLLSSSKIDRLHYFKNVSAVIIDEAHYFAADSRGSQLISSLERLQFFSDKTFQRIGLSATVGDPDIVSKWLTGTASECEIIYAGGRVRDVLIEHILIDEDDENYIETLKKTLYEYVKTGKTIIFGNSKKDVEMTARHLLSKGINASVHHGSISKYLREEAEELMKSSKKNTVISATSTLELGIDIGDLNRIIQKDLLPSVNSYMQRIGRAGRRDGQAHIVLLSSNIEDFILNLSISSLGSVNYCEPLRPSGYRYDIFLQQLLLEILGNYGISFDSFYNKIKNSYSYQGIGKEEIKDLIDFWIEQDYLLKDGNTLIIGPVIEKKYSAKNFMELYSVFDVNEFFTVFFNDEEIGYLENWFAFSLLPNESVFQLGGRKWLVLEVIPEIKQIYVKSAMDALPPEWRGSSGLQVIEYEVARRYQDILEGSYNLNDKISLQEIKTLDLYKNQLKHNSVKEGTINVKTVGKELWVETYAGTMINSIIFFFIKDEIPEIKCNFNFYRLEIKTNKNLFQKIINLIKIDLPKINNFDITKWHNFLICHLDGFSYSRFSEYVPNKYSVKHVADAYYRLDDFKKYINRLSNNFLNNISL